MESRNYHSNNLEKKKEQNKWNHKLRKYGVSKHQYEEMLINQNRKCKICGLDELENLSNCLYIDHCHSTNRVRGLLCYNCNTLLGLARDNIDILKNSIKYLEDSVI